MINDVRRLPLSNILEIGVGGMTVYNDHNMSGWSKREQRLQWMELPVSDDLIPGIKFEMIVPQDKLNVVIKTIIENARTGQHGDGVIFVSNLEQAINIATLKSGDGAIQ
jgi:nitrogen regulatory protein P-II 1